jgi:hypothetical protein
LAQELLKDCTDGTPRGELFPNRGAHGVEAVINPVFELEHHEFAIDDLGGELAVRGKRVGWVHHVRH